MELKTAGVANHDFDFGFCSQIMLSNHDRKNLRVARMVRENCEEGGVGAF